MATPDAEECTLTTCSIEWGIYAYRPSLPANATLLALFALSGLIHLGQLAAWRTYTFSTPDRNRLHIRSNRLRRSNTFVPQLI